MATDRAEMTAASRQHLTHYAGVIAVVMRHTVNLIVAVVVLTVPHHTATPAGKALLGALGVWSAYRLATRSSSELVTGIDYTLSLICCFAIPILVDDPAFYAANSAPVAIAGTAVISFSVSKPVGRSLPMAAGIAFAFACGSSVEVGWARVPEIYNLYYFALQWITSSAIRLMVIRVADAVDDARAKRHAAQVSEQVAGAVREYDREQVRLLHDTVASTLMMVAQGTSLPTGQIATQARRDLALLDEEPWTPDPTRIELVAALRDNAQHVRTSRKWTGATQLWLDGRVARHVIAAAREAFNNVDRHANANYITIDVRADHVTVSDDGAGFDQSAASDGTGIAESIEGRMQRIGGSSVISSAPRRGTVVELLWPATEQLVEPALGTRDPERLIERVRIGYGLALTAYAIANLAAAVAQSAQHTEHPGAQVALAAAAAIATLVAIPGITNRGRMSPWPAAIVLLAAAMTQSALLPPADLGGQADWPQSSIGWCLLPHVLRQPVRQSAMLIVLFWAIPAAWTLIRAPSAQSTFNIGLGTASILCVQLLALLFNELIRIAADKANTDTAAFMETVTRERIRTALHAENQRTYAGLFARIRPLLSRLAQDKAIDPATRRRAQTETRQLRALFAESATRDHPLLQTVRSMVDAAEDRGVSVSLHVDGRLPDLSEADAARLAAPLDHLLASTCRSARIATTVVDSQLTVSIVCTGLTSGKTPDRFPTVGDDDLELTCADDAAWLTIRHSTAKGGDRDARPGR